MLLGVSVVKLCFFLPLTLNQNKLECLYLVSFLFSLNFQIRSEPVQVEHLTGSNSKGKLLALPLNIGLR
jgi:hypothetical protein